MIIPEGVTEIRNSAFEDCSSFTSLTIPDSVTSIENSTFSGCSGFTGNLMIPNSVSIIGEGAFENCSGFTGDLIIPDSVTTIEAYVFSGCNGFTGNLTISNSVMTIGERAFENCSGFIGDLVIPKNITVIEAKTFSGCRGFNGNLIIPEGVTNIRYNAFSECSSLNGNLLIPNSVTDMGSSVFRGCSSFTSLTISENLTQIGVESFKGCSGFKGNLIIPKSVVTIKGEAFKGCNGFIGNLTIPNGVTTIGGSAFYDCSGFTGNLVIPNSVTKISDLVFSGCSGFTSLSIPNSITNIGYYAFYGCDNITSIFYDGTKADWNNINISSYGNGILNEEKIIFLRETGTPSSTGTTLATSTSTPVGLIGSPLYIWVDLKAGQNNAYELTNGLIWTSSDADIVPVDAVDTWKDAMIYGSTSAKAFCMVIPKKAGNTQVTITTPDGATAVCYVTVNATENAVTMDKSTYLILENGTGSVYANISAKNGVNDMKWTWTTSNPNIIDFDNNGLSEVNSVYISSDDKIAYQTSSSVKIYAKSQGSALVTCTLQDGTRASQEVMVCGDGQDNTVVSNDYNVPNYSKTPDEQAKLLLSEYRAEWEDAYKGYIETVLEQFKEQQEDEVNQTEQSIVQQAEAMQEADEQSNSKYLSFEPAFPDEWKTYAYQALCQILMESTQKSVDFEDIVSTDAFTTANKIVNQIANNISSVKRTFSYGNIEVEVNIGNYFGSTFGKMTCISYNMFGVEKDSYTIIVCPTLTDSKKLIADYLTELKTLGYDSVMNIYYALAEDLLGESLSNLTERYLTKKLQKYEVMLSQSGFGEPCKVLIKCYDYYKKWKNVYKSIKSIDPSIAEDMLNSFELKDVSLTNRAVKKANDLLEKARKKLTDATLEYITTGTIVPEEQSFWEWLFGVNCPVSVAVYAQDGTQLGLIGDNETDDWYIEDRIYLTESGRAKRIYSNEPITIKAIGQDYGTMSCYIEKYDKSSPLERTVYYNIPLQPQTEITSQNNNTVLNVINGAESEQVKASETISVTSDARISVNVSDTEGGEIIGDGYYVRGDAVILYAIEQEGYKFLGWYDENNQLETTSSLYEFTAQQNKTLLPKFIKQVNSFTNYTPKLCNGYKELCTVEVKQEDKNVTVSLEWLKNQNITPIVYIAIYDDNGKMTELIPFEITKTETGIIYSATIIEGNGTLFMLDSNQKPIFEAYTNS